MSARLLFKFPRQAHHIYAILVQYHLHTYELQGTHLVWTTCKDRAVKPSFLQKATAGFLQTLDVIIRPSSRAVD